MRLAPRSLLFLFLTLAAFESSFAQTENNAAKKFDEFGDIQISDLKARLDNFAIQLQNDRLSKGFILVYRTRRDLPGLSSRYAHRMEGYLVSSRGVEKERVVVVDGGEADSLRQELWIVPPGTAPIPRSDAYQRNFVDTDSARKFDEFTWGSDDSEPGVYAEQLETYATTLHAEPNARAYVIAYSGYYRQRTTWIEDGKRNRSVQTYRDPPGSALKVLMQARRLLLKDFQIFPSRIHLVNGGYRKRGGLELWIVPQGEHPPIATPNSFPPHRRRRK
jgi:hypothetical protein